MPATTEEDGGRRLCPQEATSAGAAAAARGWWGGFAAAGGHGYQNTEIGQIIVLAYLDAYKKLVGQLGGQPAVAAVPAR